nr:MAG TPA: hypothetical protein [Caudoviricetes sp.]
MRQVYMNVGNYYNSKDDIWAKALSICHAKYTKCVTKW